MGRELTQRYKNWCHLIDELGDGIVEDLGDHFDLGVYEKRMNQALEDLGQPIDITDYRFLYGSEYEDVEAWS